MRLRMKFSKTGRLKYIGHLDLLDIFNRAVKSAKLPVDYSKGFNPHMLISFASPLSVGLESISEYVDIDFIEEDLDLNDVKSRINARFPDDLLVTEITALQKPYTRAMAAVSSAEYIIEGLPEISDEQLRGFMEQEKIDIMKKTKRKNELTDIRPDIFLCEKYGDGSENSIKTVIACGSFRNLKPSLFMEAFCGFLGIDMPIYKLKIVRTDIFAGAGEDGTMRSLML